MAATVSEASDLIADEALAEEVFISTLCRGLLLCKLLVYQTY